MTHEELQLNLKSLNLHAMAQAYAEHARTAERGRRTYEQYLAALVNAELAHKNEARLKRLIKEAKIPLLKTIGDYDFSQRTGISLVEFRRLSQGDFLREACNIVLYGSFGVGKSHLALALTYELLKLGKRCYFTSTHNLIQQLLEAQKNLTLASLFKRLDRYDLIACDELGYIPQTRDGADLFFQLISQRSERKSLLITTNLTYSEWDKVFLSELNTAAAVDRIIHKCETFNIQGPSWRAEEAKKRNAVKTTLTPKQLSNTNVPSTDHF